MTYRLFLLKPAVMMDALVNEPAGVTYPLAEVNFDTVTAGSSNNALSGQTAIFGLATHPDDRRGRQRLRLDSDSNTLYLSRSSQGSRDGEVNIADNGPVRVYHDYRVWFTPGVIDADGTIKKDHNIAFQANSRPVSNIGMGTAADIDATSGVLRVQFPHTAQTSFATMPGTTITGYSWGLPSGAALVAGYNLTDAVIQVDFDPGFYWISLTVTDSNGETHKARCPVYARDPADDLCVQNFEIQELSATKDGQKLRVRILDEIDDTDYPDGSLIMLWDDAQIGGVTSRTHMQFIGWHTIDPASFEARREGNTREVVLECVDVAGRLAMLPGFPQHIEHNASPDKWYQMDEPTIDRMLHYLLDRHTTALELADFHFSGTGDTYKFVVRGLDGENYWDQLQRLCKGTAPDHMLTCDRYGILKVVVDPMLQDFGDRTATVQDTISHDDYEGIQYTQQRPPRFHWTRGDGIVASWTEIAAKFSVAPGGTPGQGEMAQPKGEQLIVDQDSLNAVTGHHYARINAPQTFFTIRLARPDTVGIEPADLTWVRLEIAPPYALQRGLTLSNERGLVHEVRRSFTNEPAFAETVELIWEWETVGNPAVTEVMPPPPPPPPIPIPPPDPGPNPDPIEYGDGLGTVVVMTGAGVALTEDFSVASPVYVDITDAITGTLNDLILHPWNPASEAIVLASTGVWKTSNLGTSATWSNVLTLADIATGVSSTTGNIGGMLKIVSSINVEDYIAFVFTDAGGPHIYCAYSTDGGDTWSYSLIESNAIAYNGGLDILGHLPGSGPTLIVGYRAGGSGSYRMKLWKSNDGGASWSNVYNESGGSGAGFHRLHFPYTGNENGLLIWTTIPDGGQTDVGLCYSTDGGINFTSKVASVGDVRFRQPVGAYTQDSTKVWYVDNGVVYVSDDTGDTFNAMSNNPPQGVQGAGGFPNNDSQFYVASGTAFNTYVHLTRDSGATAWVDKSGNISSLGIDATGKKVVVPNWLDSGSES